MSGQLAFDLPVRTALGRDDFYVSDANRDALGMVDQHAPWAAGRLILSGPVGAGKTHLAAIWVGQTGGVMVDGGQFAEAGPGLLDLAGKRAVAVDNADQVAGQAGAEQALFHLCNLAQEHNTPLLMTGTAGPRDWGIALPDLASRLQASALAQLSPPDDALLASVMIKLFADRQVAVDPTLVAYLVARMDRTFAAARSVVAMLDRMSLERRAPISRTLAAEALCHLFDTNPCHAPQQMNWIDDP